MPEIVLPFQAIAKHKLDPTMTLDEIYENFLMAVQDDTAPGWNEHSTFEEWLSATVKATEQRLRQLRDMAKKKTLNRPHLVKLLPEFQPASEDTFKELRLEEIEFADYVLRRTLEIIQGYRSGLYRLSPGKRLIDL